MSDDCYEPAAREIYRYNNGKVVVNADPLLLRGALITGALRRNKLLNDLIDTANARDMQTASPQQVAEAWRAMLVLQEVVVEAFNLTPFDPASGVGADMAHAIGVLDHFHKFCEKKNQQQDSPPISSTPTESTSATSPTMATSSVSS